MYTTNATSQNEYGALPENHGQAAKNVTAKNGSTKYSKAICRTSPPINATDGKSAMPIRAHQ